MEYPEEIYSESGFGLLMTADQRKGLAGWGRRHAYLIGYEVGKAEQADPLAGYSNLTAAIKAGDPIDWGRLDGLKAQCVHPTIENLTITMSRNKRLSESSFLGWHGLGMDKVLSIALLKAWYGDDGWALWVEGEIPLARKTADQLPLGTCFEGDYHGSRIELAQVIANRYGNRLVTDHAVKNIGGYAEEEVEVIKEYGIGTFQKPEGE